MDRRRVTDLLASGWGRLSLACLLSSVALWICWGVWIWKSWDEEAVGEERLSLVALAVVLAGALFLVLHKQHMRVRRGEAQPLDVRRVLDHVRSLRTSANGKVAIVLIVLGVALWAYVLVAVRWWGWDPLGMPDGDDGALYLHGGTLACAIAPTFVAAHFRERR